LNILVTGGAGYIGSHTCAELIAAGHEVTIFDNFCNCHPECLSRLETITGRPIACIRGDIRDREGLIRALRETHAEAVIHFAGLKSVGESVEQPLRYYDNNLSGTLHLLEAMTECNVKTLVFSSSATVYGTPQCLPITETHPLSTTSPYGRSKLILEEILRDLYISDPTWRILILRYFNPVGAHASGLIGEDPQGIPNNLLPFVAQVAVGRRPFLNIWGNDYPTPDGTGVRDYLHVVDLALGHIRALEYLESHAPVCLEINLGTGTGYSVLDIVKTFEQVSGRPIPFQIQARRAGDTAACYADPSKALELLGWKAERGLEDMCSDSWRWQRLNPEGFGSR
jgi:UDP-glucose 4-epimerase